MIQTEKLDQISKQTGTKAENKGGVSKIMSKAALSYYNNCSALESKTGRL